MRLWGGVVSYHAMTLIGREIVFWYLFVDICCGNFQQINSPVMSYYDASFEVSAPRLMGAGRLVVGFCVGLEYRHSAMDAQGLAGLLRQR